MIVLDEHLHRSQRERLAGWHITVRQIGYDIAAKGLLDSAVVPLLLTLRRPTFATLDSDFYTPFLCHPRYCLLFLSVAQLEAAGFVRRFLRHPQFNTQAKRMGGVARASHAGISVWRPHARQPDWVPW